MDRDKRWDRVERAYDVIAGTGGSTAHDAVAYIEGQYADGRHRRVRRPASRSFMEGRGVRIEDGDSIIFFNFRPDRAREMTHALVDADFDGFARSRVLRDVELATFTEYERDLRAGSRSPARTSSTRLRRR